MGCAYCAYHYQFRRIRLTAAAPNSFPHCHQHAVEMVGFSWQSSNCEIVLAGFSRIIARYLVQVRVRPQSTAVHRYYRYPSSSVILARFACRGDLPKKCRHAEAAVARVATFGKDKVIIVQRCYCGYHKNSAVEYEFSTSTSTEQSVSATTSSTGR